MSKRCRVTFLITDFRINLLSLDDLAPAVSENSDLEQKVSTARLPLPAGYVERLVAVVLHLGPRSFAPRDMRRLENTLGYHDGVEAARGISWVVAGDAAQWSAMHRMAPLQRMFGFFFFKILFIDP